MTLQTVIDAIKFWDQTSPPTGWEMQQVVQGIVSADRNPAFEEAFISYITTLYNQSETMRNLLEAAAQQPIYVAQDKSQPGRTFQPATIDNVDYDPFIAINFGFIGENGWFNEDGTWVAADPELVIAHEFAHRYWQTLGYSDWHDPSGLAEDQNAPDFDNDGDMVRFQNAVAEDMGRLNKLRVSYRIGGSLTNFQENENYTGGQKIDVARQASPGTDLDTSTRSDSSRDLLFGTTGNDVIRSGAGNDFLYADAGDDILDGGDGNDRLFGDVGYDVLIGRSGNDQLAGGDGDDNIDGGSGDDLLIGGSGSDLLFGGPGNDEIWGGDLNEETSIGIDIVDYSDAAKRIKIVLSGDSLIVHDGDGGMDTLHAINEIKGTQKRDLFTLEGSISTEMDTLTIDANGGQGNSPRDTINLSAATSDILLNIDENGEGSILDLDTTGVINLKGFHTSLLGSQQNDIFTDESSGPKHIFGNDGNDQITATGGPAYVDGGSGDDEITGGAYSDALIGGEGDDVLTGGAGSDYLVAGSEGGVGDTLSGGDDHDYLVRGHVMDGGAGNDVIDARGSYPDSAHNYGAIIHFGIGDGHDTIVDDGFQNTPGSYNGEITDPVDGVGEIDFGSISRTDASFIWDANATVEYQSGSRTFYEATGNLAVVIGSTGESILFQNVYGHFYTQSGSSGIYTLDIGLPKLKFVDGNFKNLGDGYLNIPLSLGSTAAYESALSDWSAGTQSGPIDGTSGNDSLAGGNGDDAISAGDGDDEVSLSGGHDSVDGGQGDDTVTFFGSIVGFQLEQITDGIRLTSISGLEGVADVTGVESFYSITDDRSWTLAQMLGRISTTGNDIMIGTDDKDVLFADAGNDTLTGFGGNDTLDGGNGIDQAIYSGDVENYIVASTPAGSMTVIDLIGIEGADRLDNIEEIYFQGSQSTILTNGINSIFGTNYSDNIQGTENSESIHGLDGNDVISAGDGNDFISAGWGSNQIDGGSGVDVVFYEGSSSDYSIRKNVHREIEVDGFPSIGSYDLLTNVEKIYFQGDRVLLSANDIADLVPPEANTIFGSEEDDNLSGGVEDDWIVAGEGVNNVDGGNGNDVSYYEGWSTDFLVRKNQDDTISVTGYNVDDTLVSIEGVYFSGDDVLIQSSHLPLPGTGIDDTIHGSVAGDYLTGADGNDQLYGKAGHDEIYGDAGNDTLHGDAGDDTLFGGSGDDSLYGGSGDDYLVGDAGADYMAGGTGEDGYDVDDVADIVVEEGDEDYDYIDSTVSYVLPDRVEELYLYGEGDLDGTGNGGQNWIWGNDYVNNLFGLAGDDGLYGEDGNDRLTGGQGDDELDGGDGSADVAVYAGLQSSFTIATVNGSVIITDNAPSSDGDEGTDSLSGIEVVEFQGGIQTGISSPIVLDLNGNGVTLADNGQTNVGFDWDGDGIKNQTGWIGKDDGFLFIDRDGNGTVTDAGELSFTSDKDGAKSDLDGLRAFDSNGDGIFSSLDDQFSQFKVWRDKNGNGRVDRKEILSLQKAGVASIDLTGEAVNQNWEWGENITVNTGSFTRTNGTVGSFSDVALSYDTASSQNAAINKAASQLSEAMAGFWDGRGTAAFGKFEALAERGDNFLAVARGGWR